MIFGGQTVKIRTFTDGVTRDRFNQPEKATVDVTVTGVLMRPFRPTEVVTLTEVATELWRCTTPPVDAALTAPTSGLLLYDGTANPADVQENRYQIIGVEPFSDLSGAVEHVRITCQRQAL